MKDNRRSLTVFGMTNLFWRRLLWVEGKLEIALFLAKSAERMGQSA